MPKIRAPPKVAIHQVWVAGTDIFFRVNLIKKILLEVSKLSNAAQLESLDKCLVQRTEI